MELLLDSRLSSDTRSGRTTSRSIGYHQTKSACTSPGSVCLSPNLPTITVSDSQLLDSVCQSESRSHSPEPYMRRSRLERMKSDVAKLGNLIYHSAGSSPVSSKDSSPSRMSVSSREDRSMSPDLRRITVEYKDDRRSSRQSLHSDIGGESPDDWDTPDHNFSSALMLTSLQDGHFAAEISLKELPMEDLVLFVCGHELEIVIDKSGHHGDKKHKVSIPYHYGVVDLPIFVETSSLRFAKDSSRNVLVLRGRTKGCFARRRSASFDSLFEPDSSTKESPGAVWKKMLRKLGFRRSKSHGTIVEELKQTSEDI